MIVTGPRAGKKYANAADQEEGEDRGIYGQGAIDWFTKANHDLELIISVWNKPPTKELNLLQLGCYKVRGAAPFPLHFAQFDAGTRRIFDLPGAPVGNHLDLISAEQSRKHAEIEKQYNDVSDLTEY